MPVPIQWIPYNIVVGILLVKTLTSNPRVDELEKLRAAANMEGPVVRDGTELEFVLIPSVPAMEYPHEPMEKVVYVGPMLADAPDINESHPTLARFITRARTVHLNMGTLFRYTEDDVRAVVEAVVDVRARMATRGGFQVLWKLPRKANFDALLESLWPDEETKDSVLIQEWLEPPSIAILQHPNIVVSVNHGGASELSICSTRLVSKPYCPQIRYTKPVVLENLRLSYHSGATFTTLLCEWKPLAMAFTPIRAIMRGLTPNSLPTRWKPCFVIVRENLEAA
jgi:hypothetical protein